MKRQRYRNVNLCRMADPIPPDAPHPVHPALPGRGPRAPAEGPAAARPSLAQRLQPWVDMLYKLLAMAFLAMALWRGLG
jgi:hypothetical protein